MLGSLMEANIAFVAGLLADRTRAIICLALAGGEARPAGELAARAGVSAQTASNHLAKLVAGRILRVEQQGRWRYYRLAGADVGYAVEALAVVAPPLHNPFAGDDVNGAAPQKRAHLLQPPGGSVGRGAGRRAGSRTVDGGRRPQLSTHAARYSLATRTRDRRTRSPAAARGPAVSGLDRAPAARRRPGGHGAGQSRPRPRLGASRAGHASGRRHIDGARAAQQDLQDAMGGERP